MTIAAMQFRCTAKDLLSGLVETIYAMRNALLHGEVDPDAQVLACYESAYRIVMQFQRLHLSAIRKLFFSSSGSVSYSTIVIAFGFFRGFPCSWGLSRFETPCDTLSIKTQSFNTFRVRIISVGQSCRVSPSALLDPRAASVPLAEVRPTRPPDLERGEEDARATRPSYRFPPTLHLHHTMHGSEAARGHQNTCV